MRTKNIYQSRYGNISGVEDRMIAEAQKLMDASRT